MIRKQTVEAQRGVRHIKYTICTWTTRLFPQTRSFNRTKTMSKPTEKKTNKPAAGKAAAPATNEKAPVLVVVTEEDDEFEEFEDADWNGQAEEKDAHIKQQWQDDWDVDEADDEFCNQLRKELQKTK
ncbi:hypothetical protein L917_19472 [Phytophthora nicotianae]|nr:hypothetical protein L915_19735 [Phytophthora nicotianae]ETL26756.1 hypothetical protein L916_19620 [Phytophthora nicotianae]ETL79996.1 hypothetical protein L917_19472 [Phytophthora nicotianae]ETM33243.1 hypothetical protein L914_19504 [Phytophthora nicotianae]